MARIVEPSVTNPGVALRVTTTTSYTRSPLATARREYLNSSTTASFPPTMSSGRTTSPTRLSIDDKSKVSRQDSFGSDYSLKDKVSRSLFNHLPALLSDRRGTQSSPTSPSSSWFQRSRTTSETETKSSFGTVNRLTHCGRHTDQYLFGGHSISELWKKKD
ncbi:hypothetical protein O1611_g1860 [Lasiodiplodia mahajangana]|uniref:Uncharacterized protein n=1 Tax=Lasiodiplodia mahajangana TaxID=1108764 RepID=A0ACC2JW67_9PEZI|nr:hypothetical protein O1611_g1860 [Lasiodiplodia mahajangana]